MSTKWKREAVGGVKDPFNRIGIKKGAAPGDKIKTLRVKVGELVIERNFLRQSLQSKSVVRRREMVDAQQKDLSIARQCWLLHISRKVTPPDVSFGFQ